MLTPDEAAVILKVEPATVREWARTGKIPARRLGRLWRFDEQEINAAGKVQPCPSTDTPKVPIGGFASRSLVERFASQRERKTARRQKNTNTAAVISIGERLNSKKNTEAGKRPQNGGCGNEPESAA